MSYRAESLPLWIPKTIFPLYGIPIPQSPWIAIKPLIMITGGENKKNGGICPRYTMEKYR
jgi:hypothetical protein